MNLTVTRVLSWSPGGLEHAAGDVEVSRRRLESVADELATVSRTLNHGWTGMASDAASGSIRSQARVAENLTETLGMIRRAMLGAADALAASQALLIRAKALAQANGMDLPDTGVVTFGPEASEEHAAVRGEIRAMVHQALRAAAEADRDAARAVRAALDAGGLTDTEERELIEDIGVHDIPVGQDPASVALWWASLSPAAQALLAGTQPELIGNLDGVPYHVRVQANRTNIANTLTATTDAISELQAQIAAIEQRIDDLLHAGLQVGLLDVELADLKEQLAYQRDLNTMCHNLLTGPTTGFDANGDPIDLIGHQVIVFDPANGRFAEIVGSLNANTQNLGVMVPGTGANLFTMDGQYDRCLDFVAHRDVDPPGSLAVVSWLGGPMPQEVVFDAFGTSYAQDLAGDLTRFVGGIDNPTGAPVTVVGHSYGGSIVGAAETVGMRADRIVHVASAGAGPGVGTIDAYAHPGTARYSMTAPGDLITYAQGTRVGSVGHGSDPDLLDDVVRLETGYLDTAHPERGLVSGPSSHSGVFDRDTTAFNNILGVMTGGQVSLFSPPVEVYHPPGPGTQGWYDYVNPMEDPSYRPPTMDVP